jgi:predicted PurR-regulated permease PerM
MARIFSFVVLVVILLLIAGLFFHVMADFLLPIFLALVLVVMFGPLFRWLLARCGGRNRLAAVLTTVATMLIVLLPLLGLVFQVVSESVAVSEKLKVGGIDVQKISQTIVELGDRVGLELDAKNLQESILADAQAWLYPVAKGTTQFLGSFLIGLIVMVISVYYFFADGPEMIAALSRLSPMDDCYKQQLIEQFANVSRAVVLATLASAVIQGLFAGVGFYLTGFHSIFLLMAATMLMSMVPFVGPPAVWVPACLWLYFVDGQTGTAIGLAIYGTLIVSTVDNIVKPMVLHGRSNLHPLLALLSVLGGVRAMGPIGIFVGPMVVAFLQTLLNILHNELEGMRETKGAGRSDVLHQS